MMTGIRSYTLIPKFYSKKNEKSLKENTTQITGLP